MATKSALQPAELEVEIVSGLHGDLTPADLAPESNCKHLLAATARANGKGECKAWLIKPELVDLQDYAVYGLGPEDPEDLMHEVFDWPRPSTERNTVHKGVKFLQQFDMDYDYLEDEVEDIRDQAWVVLFRDVHVEEGYRRQNVGTGLVRALIQEIARLAQLEGRRVLAFARLAKSTLKTEEAWGPGTSPGRGHVGRTRGEAARVQAAFWESLAFERLNDGQLFARDLDWLAWSPKARNAALLFERPKVFPVDFNALIEGHLINYE